MFSNANEYQLKILNFAFQIIDGILYLNVLFVTLLHKVEFLVTYISESRPFVTYIVEKRFLIQSWKRGIILTRVVQQTAVSPLLRNSQILHILNTYLEY